MSLQTTSRVGVGAVVSVHFFEICCRKIWCNADPNRVATDVLGHVKVRAIVLKTINATDQLCAILDISDAVYDEIYVTMSGCRVITPAPSVAQGASHPPSTPQPSATQIAQVETQIAPEDVLNLDEDESRSDADKDVPENFSDAPTAVSDTPTDVW